MEQSQKGCLTLEESIKIALPHCLPRPEHDTLGQELPHVVGDTVCDGLPANAPQGRQPKAFG